MKKRIAFLFINGTHHVYHTLPTAIQAAVRYPDSHIILICGSDHNYKMIRAAIPEPIPDNLEIVGVKEPFRFKYLNYKHKQYPLPKEVFRKSLPILKKVDAIIGTSHGLGMYAKDCGLSNVKVIYQCHGCGDRAYSFDPALADFDLILVPNSLYQRRIAAVQGMQKTRIEVVGYPKTDIVKKRALKESLFNSTNKTFVYCPHWEKELTSYALWGKQLLDYFQRNPQYNLIFAPHILVKHWGHRLKYDTKLSQYRSASNILIDFKSDALVDMTYLLAADCYIGDISSQIYEFLLLQIRPAIFLNAHGVAWKGNPDYAFWECGMVIDAIEELDAACKESLRKNHFSNIQRKRIEERFSITNGKPSEIAADAIFQIIDSGIQQSCDISHGCP